MEQIRIVLFVVNLQKGGNKMPYKEETRIEKEDRWDRQRKKKCDILDEEAEEFCGDGPGSDSWMFG